MLVPPLWRAIPVCAPWCPSLRSLPLCHGPWSCPFMALWWLLAPVLCRPRCPVPVGACPLPWATPRPLAGLSFSFPCPPLALALSLPGVVVVGWGGACGAPITHAWGWVVWSHRQRVAGVWGGQRPLTASRRSASHAACGMAASGAASLGSAGLGVQISWKVCTICTHSRLPAPPTHFTPRRSFCKAGADNQASRAGAWGGEGSELGVLERRRRGLGVEDAYGRRRKRVAWCCA